MNESEIDLLISQSSGNLRDNALFHVALATGFRVSDLVNLKVTDVVNAGSVVKSLKIRMVKTGKIVERALPDTCRKSIERYVHNRIDGGPFLFRPESTNHNNDNGPMNRSSIHRIVKNYLSQIYPPDTLIGNACHVTRRSIAQIISQKCGRIEPASRFLGHTSVANTIKYLDCDKFNGDANDAVLSMPWNSI